MEDARVAVEAGASALGFIFYAKSPRNVSLASAATIIRELPPLVAKVGVFVNESAELIRAAIELCGLDTVQLHGEEPPDFCRQFGVKTIKAFRVQDEKTLGLMEAYGQMPWLVDSYVPGKMGGTGEVLPWDLGREAAKRARWLILAGGLTPENVASAVRQVRPYAVDVSSGVELKPGVKDHAKVRAFINAVQTVDLATELPG